MSLPKWRLTQTGLIRLLFALALVLASCYLARAQESEPEEPIAAPRSPIVEAALNAINGRNPQTPSELIDAVSILQGLGASDEARSFLNQATARELDDEALAVIHDDLGTVVLVRLANAKTLMPDAREFVHKVFAAATKVRRDPGRLEAAIARLADDDDEVRRVAMFELAEAGGHAVPLLLDAMRNPPQDVARAQLQAALARLGNDAEDALIAALGAPDPFIQSVAAFNLGHVGSRRSTTHLIRPYLVGRLGVDAGASHSLRLLGVRNPASRQGSIAFLHREVIRHLAGATPFLPGLDGTLEMWTWSAERNNVIHQQLTEREASAVAAARIARDVYELDPTFENTNLLLVSRLQVDQLLGGIDKLLPRGTGSAYELGTTSGAVAACSALDYCLENGYDPAAIGAAELVGDLGSSGVATEICLNPLTRALQSPNRRIRYAAARAIMRIDPRRAYDGASFMLEALVDLAHATGTPGAVVASPRTDVRDNLAGLLGALGFTVYQTNNSRLALGEATRISDYDVLLLSDSVSAPTVDETIQQLRKDPQTKLVPVILLARQDLLEQTAVLRRLDDLVVTMPEFADEATLIQRLEEVEDIVAHVSVSPTRRLEQSKDAIGWLAHLAEYSSTYPWYDTMRARDVALNAAAKPELAALAVPLLGYLGDESSQRLLVNMASQESLALDHRQRAANAFGEAVLRRGLMLRNAAIVSQYDRYNASESADAKIQEILGQILDVIETQTKPTSITTR